MNSDEWAATVKRDMDAVAELARAVGEEYARRFQKLGEAARRVRISFPLGEE